ncbi:GNAT family N-acetyltransferase [Catenulispora subtropica]|uniref:Amikacin resistance N-acetyltransferase Eis2 n=1 Tax=Catenulispora subtropica TaxID=450798 RepID=A0ABP5EJV1_9ACTN
MTVTEDVASGARPWADDEYVLRTLTSPEEELLVDAVLADAFGLEGLAAGPPEFSVFEPERNALVEFEGEPVANVGVFTRDLIVPGGRMAAAHMTRGGVRQTHRRRGLMTRLMNYHLRTARDEHGEALAVWWASEAKIYRRYGCGLAARNVGLAVDSREARIPDLRAGGRLRESEPSAAAEDIRRVYERVLPHRPGWSSRDRATWAMLLAQLPMEMRQGYSAQRALLYQDSDGIQGYALWRRKNEWTGDIRGGEVNVGEVVAATPDAYAALWDFLLSVDLTRTVRLDFASAEEPLFLLVNEPRALHATVSDGLWIRILDVPTALAGRRYSAPLDVVLEVRDDMLPENTGRWRLTVGADGVGRCAATSDAPDLSCDIGVLGAAYLGGTPLGWSAGAGRIRELRPGALAAASAAFSWPTQPSALGIF